MDKTGNGFSGAGSHRGGARRTDENRRGFAPRPANGAARGPEAMDARRLALNALSDVTRAGGYATLALDKRLRASRLSSEDKRLATGIFYGALENRLRILYVLSQFVERMPNPAVEDILTVAAAQILFMDRVPDHAAVDEAVKQAKALGNEAFSGVVNGALRNLIRARDEGKIRYPDRNEQAEEYLSVMYSMPEHIVRRLIADYGSETAARIIAYRPDLHMETVRPNLMRMNCEQFAAYAAGRGWTPVEGVVPGAYRLKGAGSLPSDPDFRSGLFSVQGEASMLAAYAMQPRRGGNYLDACAAPGGKAALMAELMDGTGRVQAWDVHEHRVELLRAVKRRLGLDNLRPAARDATVYRAELDGAFDGVLIDAPCSGLGVMINKPDIKYRLKEEDIQSLCALQSRILDACAHYVCPGGRLVYSTCTILKDENERQVAAFLKRHPEYEPDMDAGYLPERLRPCLRDGMVQLLAHDSGIEGFFIARMRRRG